MSYCTECGKKLALGKCPNCDNLKTSKHIKKKSTDAHIKRDKKPKTKKRRNTIIAVCAAVVVAVAIGAVFLGLFLNKDASYNDAVAMLKDDEPEDAAEVFERLGSFKDSQDYLQESNDLMAYFEAVEAFEDEDHESAAAMFAALGNFEDSEFYPQISNNNLAFKTAGELFDNGDFEGAQSIYKALGDFENSAQMVNKCQIRLDYTRAVALYDNSDYLAAKDVFDSLSGFKDSKKMSLVCQYRLSYDEAIEVMNNEDYTGAYLALAEIEQDTKDREFDFSMVMDYEVFKATKDICFQYVSYDTGKDYFDKGLYYSAKKSFDIAGSILDAEELALACAQPIETKEIYVNPDFEENKVSVTFKAPDSSGNNVCIKIIKGGVDLASVVTIKAGEKIKIRLPSGSYDFRIGNGKDWYGSEEFFGSDGFYFKPIIPENMRIIDSIKTAALLIPIYRYTFTVQVEQENTGGEYINPNSY